MTTIRVGEIYGDRYRIEEIIGSGGMSTVCRATQLTLGRPVALKLLSSQPGDSKGLKRFQQEALLMAQLHHPHIATIHDIGVSHRKELYIVMEFLQGVTARQLITEAPLPIARVELIAIQLLDALHASHSARIYHRDLKPSNIFLLQTEAHEDFVKVIDFGIAKTLRSDAAPAPRTKVGHIIGSPRYMAPEQVIKGEITAATDLYILGTVLYELLTGQPVFPISSPIDAALAHINEMPKAPCAHDQQLEGSLIDLVMLCLKKQPEERPPSARAALGVLHRRRGRGKGARRRTPAARNLPPTGQLLTADLLLNSHEANATVPTDATDSGPTQGQGLGQREGHAPSAGARSQDAGTADVSKPDLTRDQLLALDPSDTIPDQPWHLVGPLPPDAVPASQSADSEPNTITAAPKPRPATPLIRPPTRVDQKIPASIRRKKRKGR